MTDQQSKISNQQSPIRKVGIIGAGTMGSGIAQVAAMAGCEVKLYDSNSFVLVKAEEKLEYILNRLIEKGRINEEKKESVVANMHYVNTVRDLDDSDLVIEAIIEDMEIKKHVFQELEHITRPDCILASNTSSLSIASLAAVLEHPKRCIGIHFFNPAPLMKLVEVIPAVQTDDAVLNLVQTTMADWGKTVATAKDTPGFIVNRVARPFYGEALRIYEEGWAHFATIDYAMKELGGFRMGPFELMDFIGNDVNYAVTESVFKAFYYDPRYKPSFTQKRYSEAGWYGKKSGRGYYHYDENGNRIEADLHPDKEVAQKIFERILIMLINEAADALFWNIASAEDIDHAMTLGVNYPKGLLAWADEKGIEWCVARMDELYDTYREDRYRCSPMLRQKLKEQKTFF